MAISDNLKAALNKIVSSGGNCLSSKGCAVCSLKTPCLISLLKTRITPNELLLFAENMIMDCMLDDSLTDIDIEKRLRVWVDRLHEQHR